jgi:mitochondrial fission protein ELM1
MATPNAKRARAESRRADSSGARTSGDPAPAQPRQPRVWLLVGEKLGDNAQARALADALGWPYEERRIAVREKFVLGKPFVRASLRHLDLARCDALEPPWPDLVIAIGRRLSMVALWIKRQARGRSRIVLIGKPRRFAGRFDLVVAASQYRLAERGNVVRLHLPILPIDRARIAAEAESWKAELAELPRPLTALLVGGPTRQLALDAKVAKDLVARASRMRSGGALFATTSRRTPDAVVEAIAEGLGPGDRLHRWQPGAERNPYLALLGLADRFVVTSDSISMMIEVARLGRPLAVYLLPPAPRAWEWLGRLLGSRDPTAIPRLLCQRGWAVELGQPFREAGEQPPDEVGAVAERVRRLVAPGER